MPMYNLLEYSDNYAGSSRSLWQFKRDELPQIGLINPNVSVTNSSSIKYKSSLLKESTADGANRKFKDAKIAVPLKYLSNFFRSLEMPLINCKIRLELNWTKNCAMSTVGNNDNQTTFPITSTKLYVPIITLTSKDNVNLTKQLNEGFKRSVYWNEYKSKIGTKSANDQTLTRFLLDASSQGVIGLLVVAFDNTTLANGNDRLDRVRRNSHRKYFLPRVDITK